MESFVILRSVGISLDCLEDGLCIHPLPHSVNQVGVTCSIDKLECGKEESELLLIIPTVVNIRRVLLDTATMTTTTVQTSLSDQILNPSAQGTTELSFLPFLQNTYHFGFPAKFDRPICEDFRRGHCPRGPACPDRHYTPPNERSGIGHLICKHYQRGLCKKGDACEFAHTFDLRGERECKEFGRFGICPQGDECES